MIAWRPWRTPCSRGLPPWNGGGPTHGDRISDPSRGGDHGPANADERGETTAQLVVLMPIVLLLIMLGVQAAVWFHAANIAQAAAARGAAAASPRGGGVANAIGEARRVVDDNGGTVSAITAGSEGDLVVVTVTLGVAHLVPFFPATVSRSQREPIERFIAEADR